MNSETETIEQVQTKPEEPKPEIKIEEPKPQVAMPILLDDRGRVMAKNNAELLRYCGAMVMAEAVPKWFDTPTKLFGALQFVRSLGLPDVAIRSVANIHGVMSMFRDLPLALCQMSKDMTYLKEFWFDVEYNQICFENKNLSAEAYGSVSFMRRGDGEIQSFSYTIDDAKASGLYPAKSASMPWSKYTKIMMRYKARALGINSLFADKINGASILEHDFNTNDPESRDVSPEKELADELNK